MSSKSSMICILDIGATAEDVVRMSVGRSQLRSAIEITQVSGLWQDAIEELNINPFFSLLWREEPAREAIAGFETRLEHCLEYCIGNEEAPDLLYDKSMTGLLPVWVKALKNLELDVTFLLCIETPASCVESIMESYGIGQDLAEGVWLCRLCSLLAELESEKTVLRRGAITTSNLREAFRENGLVIDSFSEEAPANEERVPAIKIKSSLIAELGNVGHVDPADDLHQIKARAEAIYPVVECFRWLALDSSSRRTDIDSSDLKIDKILQSLEEFKSHFEEHADRSMENDANQWRSTAQRALASSEAAASIATMALSSLVKPLSPIAVARHAVDEQASLPRVAGTVSRIWRRVVKS